MTYVVNFCVWVFFGLLALIVVAILFAVGVLIYQSGPVAWIATPILAVAVVGGMIAIAGNQ
jgi:hypothetical protein